MNDVVQWDQVPDRLTWKEKVAYVAYQISLMPQVEAPVEHIFAPGVYIREMKIPAGTMFVGRAHRYGHLCQLVKGSIIMITPNGKVRLDAPAQIHTIPGYHMVLYSITDIIGRTVHPNVAECTDTKGMEDDIFESAQEVLDLGARLHYRQMFIERGVNEEALRPVFEDNSDLINFDRNYGVQVLDSRIHGMGLIACKDFAPGDKIAPAMRNYRRTPAGRYTNHSFQPNSKLVGEQELMDLVATEGIYEGEEITVDYRILYDRRLIA